MTTKVVTDDTFMVACHNNEGLPVTWRNSKGAVLGPKTRPEARQGSYGYSIIFKSPHQLEDTGNYTCSTPKEKRVFELFVTRKGAIYFVFWVFVVCSLVWVAVFII